jgi:DNA invertase Pin-like site-specific DNA recombinase
MRAHAYLRVSTTDQDADTQRLGLLDYAARHAITVTTVTTDTASGATSWRSRRLAGVLTGAAPGDLILTPEISRIGRSTYDVLDFLRDAAAKQVSVHITKSNLILDTSIQSTIITTVLALAAEVEREFIRLRTREGMARAKERGAVLGRAGRPNKAYTLDQHRTEITRLRAAGTPLNVLARLYNVHPSTVARYLARPPRSAPQPPPPPSSA